MSRAPELAVRAPVETHVAMIVARIIVGVVFIWLSISKIENPHVFMKLLREYELPLIGSNHVLLNLTAVTLPWVEMLCGILLIVGFWLRGAAILLFAMLIGFTTAVAVRAIGIYQAETIAFCAIKFDCGCGGGVEIPICDKLRENTALIGLSLIAMVSNSRRFALDALFTGKSGE